LILTRKENWPELLLAAVEEARSKPFAWGRHDCCTFAADCVLAMTGADLMEPFRGRYTSARGAVKVVAKAGHAALADAWCAALPEIAPGMARRGDVVLFAAVEGLAVGVATGTQAVAAGPDGVTLVPMELWLKAWRV
jgi:hypothetical protein